MITYKDAGVDVEAGYESVALMKEHVKRTFRPEVLTEIGGFGGLFELKNKYKEPVLVSGTDGVGTKLKIAFLKEKLDTVGIDCVAMCVNDVVCAGAEPLFFLDYIAVGKNEPQNIADIVKGVAEGCIQAGCSLVGGETAEMPGFYQKDEFDIAGFTVGVVEKGKILDGSQIGVGDKLIGIASSGVHSNGYSLIRKLFDMSKDGMNEYWDELGCTLGDELLKPTKIYVKTVLEVLKKINSENKLVIKGIAHVTGGGFIENLPRMLKSDNMKIKINRDSWDILPIFALAQKLSNLPDEKMYNTFNMGIGMCMAVAANEAENVVAELKRLGEEAYVIGEFAEGERCVELC